MLESLESRFYDIKVTSLRRQLIASGTPGVYLDLRLTLYEHMMNTYENIASFMDVYGYRKNIFLNLKF